ncbi:MAG: ABC transporter substrate-binding protein [Chloroflexi bacterium]|nr:ABC transporter substrate-binding protein [Chloroflexota bacterium]
MDSGYWKRARGQAVTRRWALGAVAIGGAAAFVAACGGNDKQDSGSTSGGAAQQQATATGPAPAGPANQVKEETPIKGGTLRLGTFLNVLGIDPHIEVSVGLTQMAKVYTYLGGFNSIDQKFNPIFAESFEQKSPTEFVFKLRKGVKFQNIAPVSGREVTAQDVLYSMERFRDLPKAQNNDFFKTVTDKMEVVDPYTFRLTTKAPYAEALSEIGGIQKAIVAREAVEKFTDLSQNAIGAGPFIMDDYVKGERLSLKKNPDYFDKNLPHPDAIKWTTILDTNTLIQAYKSDQLDINGALLTKLDFQDLQRNDKLVNLKFPALHYGSLGLNASVKPFDDKRVRQALWLGVDRQQFIDKVALGEGTPQGVLNNGLNFWALSQDEAKPYIGYDLKKAKDLLTAAGYPNGFEMEIETSGGVQLYIDHAEVLVAELKKLGIDAKLKLTDLSAYLADKLFKGNFNATVFTHNPYESPKIPLGFDHKLGLGNLSWWHYDNPAVTAAIDAQNAELDVNKRQKMVKDTQKLILEDGGPMINFYSPTAFSSYNKRVGGYDPTLRGWQSFRISEFIKPG